MDLVNGQYEIVVEVENKEVARIPLLISEIHETDIRHDIELEWTESPIVSSGKKSAVDAAEIYERTSTNTKRFENAEKAIDAKDYGQAQSLLRQILREDEKDYQSWSELGTAYVLQKNLDQAEKAYQRATEINPAFFLAFVNLGKLRLAQDKFEAAIEPLTQAITIKPDSAQANFLLGEAYLRIKKGSKAVGYLYEALKLEPIEMAEAHLRLAAL
jgi:tetratricopeptide (TPR) repeat protein